MWRNGQRIKGVLMEQRILIIEDDIFLREELIHTFQKEGYSVMSISFFQSPEQEIINSHPSLVVLISIFPGNRVLNYANG